MKRHTLHPLLLAAAITAFSAPVMAQTTPPETNPPTPTDAAANDQNRDDMSAAQDNMTSTPATSPTSTNPGTRPEITTAADQANAESGAMASDAPAYSATPESDSATLEAQRDMDGRDDRGNGFPWGLLGLLGLLGLIPRKPHVATLHTTGATTTRTDYDASNPR